MNNIALGRYIPLNSFVHSIDPRIKILSVFLLMFAIFFPVGWIGYAILASFILLCIHLSNLNITYILKTMKPMMFMLIFLLVINCFALRSGNKLFSLGGFVVYDQAIFQTLYIVVRLALMISITTILTASTKPLDLTLGIEDILTPFKRFGVPAHIIAMMISIALRFIPTLLEETQRIMKAQASRGVDFNQGSFIEKVRGMSSLIVPLFISALQKAEDLAYAMEARGYNPDAPRTRYKQLHLKVHDILCFIVCVILTVMMMGIALL
ncbi:MAG: energy-coupling factor transporter transmembrane component T family protein [Breznakia sp.]